MGHKPMPTRPFNTRSKGLAKERFDKRDAKDIELMPLKDFIEWYEEREPEFMQYYRRKVEEDGDTL